MSVKSSAAWLERPNRASRLQLPRVQISLSDSRSDPVPGHTYSHSSTRIATVRDWSANHRHRPYTVPTEVAPATLPIAPAYVRLGRAIRQGGHYRRRGR